jgi:ribosomal protein S4
MQNAYRRKWEKLKAKPVLFSKVCENSSTRKIKFEKKWLRHRFGERLRNKQALKAFYGPLRERTFQKYLIGALSNKKQDPQENLLQQLECRLDTLLFRSGNFISMFQARQAILHNKVSICKQRDSNFKIINVPSYNVKIGEIIKFKSSSTSRFGQALPNYLTNLDENTLLLVRKPLFNDIRFPFKVVIKDILQWGH